MDGELRFLIYLSVLGILRLLDIIQLLVPVFDLKINIYNGKDRI